MTMLISFFGFAGRIAGDLLTSALGWASSLLFGRVPRSHQVFLVLMMAGSFTWLLLLLGLVLPSIAALLLSAILVVLLGIVPGQSLDMAIKAASIFGAS